MGWEDTIEDEQPTPYHKVGSWEDTIENEPGVLDQLADSTIHHLPELGMMAGGTIGAAPGIATMNPAAALAGGMRGAGIGGYLGKATQNLIRPPKDQHEYLTGPMKSGAEGIAYEGLGGLLHPRVGRALLGAGIGATVANDENKGKGAVIGGVVGGLGIPGMKKLATNLGPTEEAINARLAGRAQPTAESYSQLGERMASDIGKLDEQIAAHDAEAWNTLPRKFMKFSKSHLINLIRNYADKLKPDGKFLSDADKAAYDALMDRIKKIEQYDQYIPQSEVKSIIQGIDKDTNWADQTKEHTNNALKWIRGRIDQRLKTKNKAYKNAMKPVSDRMKVKDALVRKFNLKHEPGKGLVPTDTTASKIQTALRENKAVTQEELRELEKFTGTDYLDLANDYRLAKQFESTGGERSSARTNLGAATGGALGALGGYLTSHTPMGATAGTIVGGAIGSNVGKLADRYGGVWAAKMIDHYVKTGNAWKLGKFGPILEAAAARGPHALSVISSMLMKDPEFQQVIQEESQPKTE